jgi:7,8-dihydropterin-6-yl-methyl-4-(beta-D-ribofuranosyl)aminobenzene 5'-phosphate synthase
MQIITLIENLVSSSKLKAEHGLSLYIETETRKILFDTGFSGLFLQNAQTLGISIKDIDCLVLSHGHNDHTGGLYPFLEKNSKAKIYIKRDIFTPKYKGQSSFIGTHRNNELLSDRLVYIDEITEIDEQVFIMPDISIYHPVDTHFNDFNKKTDHLISDEFDDELFLVIKQKDAINIITGCSHRGITNICTTATNHFNLPINLILGGFHMKNCTSEQYVHITHYFRLLQPKSLGICHCTGVEKYADMHHDCESNLFYNNTGNTITI